MNSFFQRQINSRIYKFLNLFDVETIKLMAAITADLLNSKILSDSATPAIINLEANIG